MSTLSRKEFLRLAAASAAASVLGGRVNAAAQPVAARPDEGAARSTLIREVDLLSMDPGVGEASAVDVLIHDGRIAAIGKKLAHPEDAVIVEARDMILMPGMIDGHRHAWEAIGNGDLVKSEPRAQAGYMLWLRSTIVSMTPEDQYIAQLVGGLQAIDSGVTSMFDHAHGQHNVENALAAARGLRDSGIAGWFGLQLGREFGFRPGAVAIADVRAQMMEPAKEESWRIAQRVQEELFADTNAPLQFALAPKSGVGFSIDTIREEWTRARAMGVKLLTCHVHKPQQPHQPGVMGHRDSGILDLAEAELLGEDLHLSHGNRLTAQELKLLRDSGGRVCATPMGEFPYLAREDRGASVHGRARAAGVATGIGVDVPMSLVGDYFEHLRSAFWSHYADAEGRRIVEDYKSEDSLDFVTAMGARAIRIDDQAGTIRVGKRADLVLLRTDRIGFPFVGSLADRVVNFATVGDIDSVWIAGKARKRHRRLLGVDWPSLRRQLQEAQQRVTSKAKAIQFV